MLTVIGPVSVTQWHLTRSHAPCEWRGVTGSGLEFLIRYQNGALTIQVGEEGRSADASPVAVDRHIRGPAPHTLTTREMAEELIELFDFHLLSTP